MLEFTRAEGEVSGVDFVAKGLSDLSDTKGKFDPVRVHYVFVLYENGLRGLRAKVGRRVGIMIIRRSTHLGFEHKFEVPGLGEERTVFRIVVCDFFFLGCGFSEQGEFLGRDLLIREELGVKLPRGFPSFVFILVRLVQKDGVVTIDGPFGLFMRCAGEVVSDARLWFDLVGA